MVEKRLKIAWAAADDSIDKEGWSVSIPHGLSHGSGMRSVDILARSNRSTLAQQKLLALEQAAILHRLDQAEQKNRR